MNTVEFFSEENCYITELLNNPGDPAVSVARVRVLPGETTHWHSLTGITERYLIVEGTGVAEIGDGHEVAVEPGQTVTILPGIRQRITNTGKGDLIFLAVCTPRYEQDKYQS